MKMKKVFLFALATAVMSFAGCQEKEQEAPVNPNEGGSTFEFVADIAQTKTTLDVDNGYKVDWEEGDLIYMVTSDGTWGKPYNEDEDAVTVAEFKYADGKFTSDATIAAREYTFKGMYAAATQKSYHRGASSIHKLEATQIQDCANPTAHIKANDALVGTFTATVPMTEMAKMKMSHLYTLMQVNVKNATGASVEVAKFEMTAAGADLAGIFNVTAFDKPALTTKQDAASTITVNVTGGSVENNASLPVYFVMAPLSDYKGDVTFKVTDSEGKTYTKTVTMNGISFEAGEYNTTPYTIKEADVEQPSSWVLTDLAQIKAGDQVVIVSTKSGSSYAMSNDKAASAAPAAVKVTVSNSMLSETPADNLIWHFDVANDQYTFYKDPGESAWLYCTNTNNGVRVGTNTDKVFEIKDDYLYHVAQKRYLGVYNAQDWRCYTSINNNITGQALQFYVKTIGVETPDVPTTPELTITPELIEVPAAGGNADFSYEVVNPIEGTSVSASTTVDWITGFDYNTPNKVIFTVLENTLEEAREAVIKLDYEGAESKTVTVKQDAKVPEGMLVDVLTRETTGVTNTSYAEWSGKTASSDAVYAGNTAGGNSSIQMRDNTNSGIVTTTSGGYAKKVVVTWNTNTADDRTLNIYGNNTAYTSSKDLHDSTNQGTLLGKIKYGTSTEFVIPGNYQYIGLRSASGAMYISEIQITWTSSPMPLESIDVSEQKTEYYVRDSFVAPTVTATYSDGSSSVVSGAEFSGYDMSKEGEQTVTVSYTQGDVTKETTYIINVKAKPALESIVIDGTPKTEYTVGDTFVDPSVKATYSDGSSSHVLGAVFTGYDLETAGNQTVNVSYTENGITKSTSYGIVVKAAQGVKKFVKVTSAPTDWSGTYLIVYESGKVAFDGSRTTMDAASNTKAVTITNGEIEATDAMMSITFDIAKNGTSYTVKSKSGYYVGQSSNANGLKSSTSTKYNHTISLSGTDVNLTSGGAYLRYNAASDQNRFRYYKSSSYTGQKSIQLYKLVD